MSEQTPQLTSSTERTNRFLFSGRTRHWLLAAALLLITLAVYYPGFQGPFTWDDDRYVTNLSVMHEPGGLLKIWTDYKAIPDFYPLTFTVLWAEYQIFGEHPYGFHVTNVVLHGLAGIAAWLLLRRLGLKSAWLAAFVFAVHPVHVESVAWITEIKNVLSLLFAFLAAERYLKFAGIGPEFSAVTTTQSHRWRAYGAGIFLLICALLSKSATCTLPVILALLIWLRKPADLKKHVLYLLPWLAVAAGIAAMTAFVESMHVSRMEFLGQITLLERAAIAGRAVIFYLGKVLWPEPILLIYPKWNHAAIDEQWPYVIALIVLIAALAGLIKKIGKAPLIALLIYIIALSPTLGFVSYFTMWYSYVFDHYQYMGTLAVIALICETGWFGVTWLKNHMPQDRQQLVRLLAGAVAGVILFVFSSLSFGYAAMWGFPESLWRFTVENNPTAFIALQNLAIHITERKNIERNEPITERYNESIMLLSRAIEVEPRDHRPYMILAQLYNWMGDYPAAMAYFRKSRELMPQDVRERNQGNKISGTSADQAVVASGDSDSPIPLMEFSQPFQAGQSLEKLGEFTGAIARYRDALTLNPDNVSALIGQGRCYIALRETDRAITALIQATSLRPAEKEAWRQLSAAYRQAGKMKEAEKAEKRIKK